MSVQLTSDAIRQIYDGNASGASLQPVLQVMDIRKLQAKEPGKPDRYRVVISDGACYQQAMLASQMTKLVIDEQVKVRSIVRLRDYQCNVVAGRRIAIVLTMDVIEMDYPDIIGKPVNVEQAGGASTSGSAQSGQASSAKSEPQESSSGSSMSVESLSSATKPNFSSNNNKSSGSNNNVFSGVNSSSSSSSMTMSSGGGQLAGNPVFPVAQLNPYQNNWTIQVRVTAKGDVRRWSNARGEGKLFSVELLDKEGGEIKATMFNEAVDRFQDVFQPNQVYRISQGTLKPANRQYNTLNNNYELTLDNRSVVELVPDDQSIGTVQFDLVAIDKLQNQQPQSAVDVIGVIKDVGESSSLMTRKGTQTSRRNVTLIDQSSTTVSLTMWGNLAEDFQGTVGQVMGVKGAKVSDYNGVSLSVWSAAGVHLSPDIKEAHELTAWYQSGGASAPVTSLTEARGPARNDARKTLSAITEEGLGRGEKPDWLTVDATVAFIKSDNRVYYDACPSESCNKKVVEIGGQWRCESCDQSYETSEKRYVLSLNALDHSGSHWLSAFNDTGKLLLGGTSADDLAVIREQDELKFKDKFKAGQFRRYIFNMRVKEETYNEQSRVKASITTATPFDYAAESKKLLEEIAQLRAS